MYIDQNKIILPALRIDQKQKGVDYLLTSDDNGLVSWRSPNFYTGGKDFDHYVGEHFGGGIVVAVFREAGLEKCLVVAPQDIVYEKVNYAFTNIYSLENRVPWSNVVDLSSGATSSVFGATNSARITAQAGFDPNLGVAYSTAADYMDIGAAVSWCGAYVNPDLGAGVYDDWYLPSIYELMSLDANRMIVNKVLASIVLDQVHPVPNNFIPFDEPGRQNTLVNEVSGSYWSSTERSAGEAFYVEYSDQGSVVKSGSKNYYFTNFGLPGDFTGHFKARPFRIASEGGVSLKFDATYLVISYKFFEGNDVDTLTRMVYPNSTSHPALITPWNETVAYNDGVNGGPKSANFLGYYMQRPWANGFSGLGYDYTPNVTSTIPAPAGFYNSPMISTGNNTTGIYSVLRHSGDNQGTGEEQVIVNIEAFKAAFPGVNTIEIDCRAYRRYATTPDNGIPDEVYLGVRLYKGGQMIRKSDTFVAGSPGNPDYFVFENPTATATSDLDSIPVIVPMDGDTSMPFVFGHGVFRSKRLGIVRYNIDTKVTTILQNYSHPYAVETY